MEKILSGLVFIVIVQYTTRDFGFFNIFLKIKTHLNLLTVWVGVVVMFNLHGKGVAIAGD